MYTVLIIPRLGDYLLVEFLGLCHPKAGPRDPGSANFCLSIIRYTPGFLGQAKE